MINRTRILSTGLIVATLALAGCGSDEKSAETTAASEVVASSAAVAGTTASAAGPVLTISGFAFSPVTAAADEIIMINNEDDAPHTVTADDGSFNVELGTTAELEIAEPGTYAIHCEIHKKMVGTIVIE